MNDDERNAAWAAELQAEVERRAETTLSMVAIYYGVTLPFPEMQKMAYDIGLQIGSTVTMQALQDRGLLPGGPR